MKYNMKVYVDRATQRLVKERRRRRVNNLSAQQRYEAAKRSAEKTSKIQRVCERYWELGERYIDELVELGMKKPAARRRLQRLSRYGFQRAPNGYNAFIHIKSLEINPDLPEGDRKRLADLQAHARAVDWDAFSRDRRNHDEIESMKATILQYRQTKNKGSRSQFKAQAKDAHMTLERVDTELDELASRSDVSNMRVTVRRSSGQTIVPNFSLDPVSKKFVEVCLGLDPDDFVSRFESYSVSGLAGVAKKENERRVLLKQSIRSRMRFSIRQATRNAKAEMSWLNYESGVIQKYGIELVGWPVQPIGPIDGLSATKLQAITDAFSDNRISWRSLTEEELRIRGGKPPKPRKTRSDAGKPRGSYTRRDTAQTLEMDEEASEEDEDEGDDT
ncbi:hypothetical protein DFH11DRAFT_1549292 [Phellopilus nigrolimitatus]|nr:hypothetical protein DFH11DRAFT_1549292 [Phellopilus nigrolimitatus]